MITDEFSWQSLNNHYRKYVDMSIFVYAALQNIQRRKLCGESFRSVHMADILDLYVTYVNNNLKVLFRSGKWKW